MATSKASGTASPKVHWATTPEGKKKLAEAQRKSWRARRFAARRTPATNTNSIDKLMHQVENSNSLEELGKIQEIVNLKSRLLATLASFKKAA